MAEKKQSPYQQYYRPVTGAIVAVDQASGSGGFLAFLNLINALSMAGVRNRLMAAIADGEVIPRLIEVDKLCNTLAGAEIARAPDVSKEPPTAQEVAAFRDALDIEALVLPFLKQLSWLLELLTKNGDGAIDDNQPLRAHAHITFCEGMRVHGAMRKYVLSERLIRRQHPD